MAVSHRVSRRIGGTWFAAAVLIVVAIVASQGWWMGWTGKWFSIAIGNGGVGIGAGYYRGTDGGFGPDGWSFERLIPTSGEPSLYWDLKPWIPSFCGDWAAGDAMISLPLWPVVLVLAGTGVVLWRRGKQIDGALPCPSCGYSLHGLPASTKCPECGRSRLS